VVFNSMAVFLGSSPGGHGRYVGAARALGLALAAAGIEVVYGGASVGCMGELADAAKAAGGTVVGVMPRALAEKEIAHAGLDRLHLTGSMHERKALMAELSDGFIALPGGLGTLEELCEVLTWAQLGFHAKPCGVLDVGGYWDGLFGFLDTAVKEGFLRTEHREMVIRATTPEELLERMRAWTPVHRPKWVERDDL
jgi:hypothetical protein